MTKTGEDAQDRAALKRRLFGVCDKDNDGVLRAREMRYLAELVGFEGSDEEWREEYEKLCREHNLSPPDGIPETVVMKLLDDESQSGCYFTDAELAQLVRAPPSSGRQVSSSDGDAAAGTSREALKRQLFRKCDKDGDGALKSAEMRELAGYVGFEGSDAEWAEEYEKLCEEHGVAPTEGVRESTVLALLDDESATGCFCTTKELMQFLGVVAPPPAEPSSGAARGSSTSWVFFAGASPDTSESVLRQEFEAAAGKVLQFDLFHTPEGAFRGIGRAEFATEGEAQRCVQLVNQKEIEGCQLMVKLDGSKGRGGGKGGGGVHKGKAGGCGRGRDDIGGKGGKGGGKAGKSKSSMAGAVLPGCHRREGKSIFFKGASLETPPMYLQQIFAEVGRLLQFCLFRDEDGVSRGMGIVTYHSAADARGAMDSLKGTVVDGRELLLKPDSLPDSGSFDAAPWGGVERAPDPNEAGGGGAGRIADSDRPLALTWYDGDGQRGGGRSAGSSWTGRRSSEGQWEAVEDWSQPASWSGGGGSYGRWGAGEQESWDSWERWDGWGGGAGGQADGAKRGRDDGAGLGGAPEDEHDLAAKRRRASEGDSPAVSAAIASLPVRGPATLFFAGAPAHVDAETLRLRFEELGLVEDLALFRLPSGGSRGMGRCRFRSSDAAAQALREGVVVEDRLLLLRPDAPSPEDRSLEEELLSQGMPLPPPPPQPANSREASLGDDPARLGGMSASPQGRTLVRPSSHQLGDVRSNGCLGIGAAVVAPDRTVYFLNMPTTVTGNHLESVFHTVGLVNQITLYTTPEGASRGMGTVEYVTAHAAHNAPRSLHNSDVEGRQIVVVGAWNFRASALGSKRKAGA